MPRYGLGYLEQLNELIPESIFGVLPEDYKKPSVTEMQKLFTLMDGCKKHKLGTQWMKEMLNWDIYTHPEEKYFGLSHTSEEKLRLSQEWKEFMDKSHSWISFSVWKSMKQSENV